jgi:transmembrane sensor
MPNPRLEYLFFLQTDRTINQAEREELLRLIDDPANDDDLRELISRAIEAIERSIPLPDEPSRAILLTILQTALPEQAAEALVVPMYHPKQTRRWTGYAAAIVLLLVGSAAWWALHWSSSTPTQNNVSANDVAPGGNRAILTLSNGQTITLDSASDGLLAQQGAAKVVKKADGQLAYTQSVVSGATVFYNTMTTPRGGQYQLTLADGTKVWLNAASSITYPTTFLGNERRVKVTGEVYFEVTKNASQPFKVTVKDREEVEVLGTSFNINAYSDEIDMRTTLLQGSVRVMDLAANPVVGVNTNNGKPGFILKPGQQAQIESGHPFRVVGNANVDQVVAWKNGLFQFDNADIQTVMRQLSRWYDVDVSFEGPTPDIRFVGKLPREANASQVLRVLQKEQVHFRIEGKKIIVTQ